MIAAEQRARIAAVTAGEPDLLAIETIPSGREAAILAELLTEVDVEAWVTLSVATAPISATALLSTTPSGR